jgi:hypothetical protein
MFSIFHFLTPTFQAFAVTASSAVAKVATTATPSAEMVAALPVLLRPVGLAPPKAPLVSVSFFFFVVLRGEVVEGGE